MTKIQMKTPLVEMDGDEMTRVLWSDIKTILLEPYVDLKTEYYDLGLPNRDLTDDKVTIEAANQTKLRGVAVKCATITPNQARVEEYQLKEMWKSPNGTIRSILDGTVFRKPIMVRSIKPQVTSWKKPITLARHAYGDVYKNVELLTKKGDIAELVITSPDHTERRVVIHQFNGNGMVQGQHNTDQSIYHFATACFTYGLETKQDVWFATKDTISKKYDHRFKDIFEEVYNESFKTAFEKHNLTYLYTLIDDAVARIMKSEGGILWATKNYDGDVMSDMIASANGSLAMMTSVLVSPDKIYEYEAAHGTVTKHYEQYKLGKATSTNPMATIFAWTGALKKRGELDQLQDLVLFATKLEEACIKTIESGYMTGDLIALSDLSEKHKLDSKEFLLKIRQVLSELI